MAATVHCTNPACPEADVAKTNPGFDPAEIRCGACGGAVEAGPDADEDT